MEKVFLTLEELQSLRPLSPNLNTDKVEIWILEAQLDEMRTFLGGVLYKLMDEDFDAGAFQEERFVKLWLGDDTGEELFFGLYRAIGLFSISNLIKNNTFNVTRFANSELVSEIEEQARETAATSKASQAYSQGIKMLAEAERYLEENKDLYPEFEINLAELQPTTFKYIRVPPNKPNLKWPLV